MNGGRAVSFRDEQLAVSYDAGTGGLTNGVLAVLAGVLDDRRELAGTLGSSPADPQHELAAAAYRRWGVEGLARLRGSFALLLWDTARGHGLIAVDQLGAGGTVYTRAPGTLAFAAELRDLLPLLDTAPEPSEPALVRWLVDGTRDRGETFLTGVCRLPGGHLLRLDEQAAVPEPYWRPRYGGERRLGRAEAARELRTALERAVVRGCERQPPSGILLSGGLDSTSVAAVARAAGRELVAYTAVFPQHPATDESALVAERTQLLGLPSAGIAFRRGGALAAGLRSLERWKLPPASPNLFFHEPLLQLARREGIATMLDGQGGDELLGESRYLIADRLRSGRWLEAAHLARTHLGPEHASSRAAQRHVVREIAVKGLLPARLHRWARDRRPERYAPPWLTDEGSRVYAGGLSRWSWKEARGPRWWSYLAHVVTAGRERAGAHESLRHMFADAGLRGSHPLLEDVDLVEAVLALPPAYGFHERLSRPLLREAVADLLPDRIRLREEKSYFNDVLADAVHVVDEPVIRRLLGPGAELRRFVRADVFDRLRAIPEAHRGRRETLLLWRFTAAECWLQTQADSGFPAEALQTWELAEPRFELVPRRG